MVDYNDWLEEVASALRLFHSALTLTDLSRTAEYQRAVTRAHQNIEKGLESMKSALAVAVRWHDDAVRDRRSELDALDTAALLKAELDLARKVIHQLHLERQREAERPSTPGSGDGRKLGA